MLNFLRKITPNFLKQSYHWLLAHLAALLYFYPSNKLIVIGVIGTKGKSSTTNFISQYLESFGKKTGLTSTINFKIGDKEWLNDNKMTMLGRFQAQKFLSQMVKIGCEYAVIESSSQGVEQFRHLGINYDVVVFTNLTPEHIEAHGGFENYRAAKEKLFKHLSLSKHKIINNKRQEKIIVANADDDETQRLGSFKVDNFFTYGIERPSDLLASEVRLNQGLLEFKVDDQNLYSQLFGKFNAYNILAALTVIKVLGLELNRAIAHKIKPLPGRQEWINNGQNFKIMVDYAYEPVSLEKLYQNIKELKINKLITVLGAAGGSRDHARQPILGQVAGKYSDIVIATNDDPYDDNPEEIMNKVASGAKNSGKIESENLFQILDRKQAIHKALSMADFDDLVLVTGKGAEQFMCVAKGKKIPWDDRKVVKEYFRNDLEGQI